MKILLTGSNGLLGQKLVALLHEMPEVELVATARGDNRPGWRLPPPALPTPRCDG